MLLAPSSKNYRLLLNFIAGLGEKDRVALVTFSDYVRLWQSLTTDRSVLLTAVTGIFAAGNTALTDGLYGGLSLAEPPAERPIVVLFSDGLDNASRIGESELLEVVRESNAVVYVVRSSQSSEARVFSPLPRRTTGLPQEDQLYFSGPIAVYASKQRDKFLRRVADESGGRFIEIDGVHSMKPEFGRALDEIKSASSYRHPKGVDREGWHDIDVKLKNRKADLRARRGYTFAQRRQK